MSTSAASTKACYDCGSELSLDHFARRNGSRDGHKGRCKACDARYMRAYRRRRRAKTLDKFAGELGRERSLNRAAALASEMSLRFGGVQRLAKTWADQLQAAAAERPGSATTLRGIAAVVRLLETVDRQKPKFSDWTDQELEREHKRLLADG